ncbi:hypothetical protein SAMN05660748_2894 [Blastococcus aggregatus]|uniref:Uncharacterized protein n=1 Tax=Blastococcus aggregatus TaxID=38502 RepID=A0A285V7R1_9ACTN|nr:hypothetical protein [Blastococcus aggregatus]SOC50155.1 hypothetical protein SAMN05660748_2894 [Blastococcus aggregatus]
MPGRATSQDFAAWLELNPDTRAHLWLTCSLLVDELRAELDATDADCQPWEVELGPFGFADCLPSATRGSYDAYTALAFTHALDAVIWKLGNQPGTQPSCTMEAFAMRAVLERAEILVEELQEVLDSGEPPWWSTGHDPGAVDMESIPDLVFQDLDHEMLFMPHLDGIENDEQLAAVLGLGEELTVRGWLTPYDNATDRGHPLTWSTDPSPPSSPTG